MNYRTHWQPSLLKCVSKIAYNIIISFDITGVFRFICYCWWAVMNNIGTEIYPVFSCCAAMHENNDTFALNSLADSDRAGYNDTLYSHCRLFFFLSQYRSKKLWRRSRTGCLLTPFFFFFFFFPPLLHLFSPPVSRLLREQTAFLNFMNRREKMILWLNVY